MKNSNLFWTLLLELAAIIVCTTAYSEEDENDWKEFKMKFMKNYLNEEEENYRKKIFFENRQYISSHNRKSSKITFVQGLNHLSDWTTEEVNSKLNGFRLNESSLPELRPIEGFLEALLIGLNGSLAPANEPLAQSRAWYDNLISPASLDYRASGRVSKVKDQGSCGSCWSFTTTGALKGTGKAVLLSQQNLVGCSRSYGNYGCNGGLMDAAMRYVRDHGIMLQADYPYTGKDESCKFQRNKSVTNVRGSVLLPHGNEALLRLALAMTGPIPVAIDAGAKSFHSYKSGVYNDDSCHNSARRLNHAVLLVGYGTDRNKWGDSGYVKMARNHRNLCGIATFAVLPIP